MGPNTAVPWGRERNFPADSKSITGKLRWAPGSAHSFVFRFNTEEHCGKYGHDSFRRLFWWRDALRPVA